MFAKQQAAALNEIKSHLDLADIYLAAIGSGNQEQAQDFIDKLGFEYEVFLNSDLSAYKTFRLKRAILRTLGPSSLAKGVKAIKKGFRQGSSAGDLWQQGGIFVLGPGRQLLFQHRNSFAGDHADLNQVIQALDAQ